MFIDFSNRLTLKKVQEMIDDAVDFTTGILNLSNASPQEIIEAFQDPDRWLLSYTYSGVTYIEQYRRANSGESYDVHFYVEGAPADYIRARIFDGDLTVNVNTVTGEVSAASTLQFVPNIIYNLDRMSAAQLIRLSQRLTNLTAYPNRACFGIFWTYNGKRYYYTAGQNANTSGFYTFGTSVYYENSQPTVYYDKITIKPENGAVTHEEYTSNITLTAVQ